MHAYSLPGRSISVQQHGWARFVTMQDHYNLIYREEERDAAALLPEGVAVIPWSPLARGRLTVRGAKPPPGWYRDEGVKPV